MSDIDSLFDHWLTRIRSDGVLSRPLGEIVIALDDDPNNRMTARIWPEEPPRVEISRQFVDEVSELVGLRQCLIVGACLDGIEYDPSDDETANWIAESANELLLSFVMLHEIFHVLCGHVGEFATSSAAANFAFEEHSPSFAAHEHILNAEAGADRISESSVVLTQAMRESYYKELEADNCALQCLTQLPLPETSSHILMSFEEDEANRLTSIDECAGVGRIVGYRLLLVVAWQMIQIMEGRRGPDLRKRFPDHPYPGARLLAAISTLLEGFAGIEVDKAGDRTLTLDEDTSSSMKLFNEKVLKPVIKQDWPVRDESDALSGVETFPLWIAKETLNLLRQQDPETASGKELDGLNSIRRQMVERMSGHRYYRVGGE